MEKKWPSTFTFIGDFDRSLQPSFGHSTFNPALPRLVKAFQSGSKICAVNLWNVCGALYLRKFLNSWILANFHGFCYFQMLGHDFVFYHGHKLLHHRKIYKYIHKKHHEWQAPIAAAAEYAHPIEHVITGLFSASLGLMITAAPIPVMWLWFTWLGFQVQNDHSGYHFPLMFSPEFHDYHHLK